MTGLVYELEVSYGGVCVWQPPVVMTGSYEENMQVEMIKKG